MTQSMTLGPFIDGLCSAGLASPEIAAAMDIGERASHPVRHQDLKRIVESGQVSAVDLARHMGEYAGLPVETEVIAGPVQPALDGISATFLMENRLLPCNPSAEAGGFDDNGSQNPEALTLLVSNPFDRMAIRSAQTALRRVARIVVIPLDEMEILLQQHLSSQTGEVPSANESRAQSNSSLSLLLDLASGTPVVAIVNELLEQAVDMRATDIHLEPTRKDLSVRYRIDGVLRKMPDRSAEFADAIVSRIKILAKLDIAEKRKPQDGAARLAVHGSDIDLRIATLPTNHGESVVIRLLARNSSISNFASMGIGKRDLSAITRLLDQPYGMIAVTGPTGSGKTTTLATALNELNDTSRKIVTIEDPIEYQIDNVAQSQVRPEIGSTFATAIRAFVRQDPDVIMVGEIRDGDTAKAAVQAAQTGHLLLTTLHANTAISAVARLRDLGVESYLLASNLRGVIAQRLVRVLCQHCKQEHKLTDEDLASEPRHGLFDFRSGETVFRAKGCSRCSGSGYRGRAPVFEVFEITDEIALAIGSDAPALKLQELAVKGGMTTLSQDAKRLAEQGVTSPEEIFRVTAYL